MRRRREVYNLGYMEKIGRETGQEISNLGMGNRAETAIDRREEEERAAGAY